jgi:guanylate kinase
MSATRGRLVVMSGPSGAGKTTIKERLRAHPAVTVAITATTRPPRPNERPDVDYHFVTREQFLQMKQAGRFAETNDVFGNGHLYGSLREELEDALQQAGRVYLMEVDVIGAANLRKAGFEATYIFITPPDMAELERRLRTRATDDTAAIDRRLARAREELADARASGAVVIENRDVDATVKQIFELIGLREEAPQAR